MIDWVYDSEAKQNNPNPAKLLNVQQWVNAYRSGDYIGRNLWQRSDNNSLWKLGDYFPCELDNSRKEFCIGAGAHTRYWDETAIDIAQELDRLIKDI